jgi:hypothetical protein
VPSPFGFGLGVSDLGALGDSLTPPRGPISASFSKNLFALLFNI